MVVGWNFSGQSQIVLIDGLRNLHAGRGRVLCPRAYSIVPQITTNLRLVWVGVQAIKQIHPKQTANFRCKQWRLTFDSSVKFGWVTPNSHHMQQHIMHAKVTVHQNGSHNVHGCVHTECVCATMIVDGFQPQMCTGAWCGML